MSAATAPAILVEDTDEEAVFINKKDAGGVEKCGMEDKITTPPSKASIWYDTLACVCLYLIRNTVLSKPHCRLLLSIFTQQ